MAAADGVTIDDAVRLTAARMRKERHDAAKLAPAMARRLANGLLPVQTESENLTAPEGALSGSPSATTLAFVTDLPHVGFFAPRSVIERFEKSKTAPGGESLQRNCGDDPPFLRCGENQDRKLVRRLASQAISTGRNISKRPTDDRKEFPRQSR
jgi:hypothetical protein